MSNSTLSDAQLFERAKAIRPRAYAPYSHFLVGAAIEDEQGQIHQGCNVENAAYPLGSCAEGGAIAAMIASGGTRIQRIAIVGGREGLEACTPCGGCRQRIAEFADAKTRILLFSDTKGMDETNIAALLPGSFSLLNR